MNKFYKKNKSLIRPLIITLGILLIPLIGTMFIEGWVWGPVDFIVMGVLIFVTGFMIEFANKKIKKTNYKIIVIGSIIFFLLLIWIELATNVVSHWIEIFLR